MKKIGGMRRKTRHKLKKTTRQVGKISLKNYFQSFNKGDKVSLGLEPAVQKGMYHPRFSGRVGIISAKRGECYSVAIIDGGKEKKIISHPVHLRKA